MNRVKVKSVFLHAPSMYLFFCTGLIYGMFFWPLAFSVFSISLAAYWLFFTAKTAPPQRYRKALAIVFLSVFLVTVVGLAGSSNLPMGFARVQRQLPLLLFPVVFAFSRVPDSKMTITLLGHYLTALLLTVMAGIIHGLIRFHDHPAELFSDGGNLVFPHTYPYILGLQAMLGLTLLAEKTLPEFYRSRGLRVFAALLLTAYIYLLNVRMVSICCTLLILFYAFQLIPRNRSRLTVAAVLLLVGGLLFLQVPTWSEKWQEMGILRGKGSIPLDTDSSLGRDWGGTAIRVAIWKSSRELLQRNYLTGVGTGDVQDSLQQAYRNHKFYFASEYNQYNIHNEYLNMILVAGLGALALLLAAGLFPLICWRRDRFGRVRSIFLLSCLAVFLTEVMLDNSRGAGWYAFANALLAFGGYDSGEATATPNTGVSVPVPARESPELPASLKGSGPGPDAPDRPGNP